MQKPLLYFLLSVIICIVPSGCTSRAGKLYKAATVLTNKVDKLDGGDIKLENANDSIAYLMGYIYGESFKNTIDKENIGGNAINVDEFETGVAMVLSADSVDLSLLKGIMAGMTLRNALDRLEKDVNIDWNSTDAYQGVYCGMNSATIDKMPRGVAEETLNRMLYRYFLPSDSTDKR